ncbi:MAG TPA: universal stress protein [Cyclobacteriaceae bacterium]|nr:universal stress protein [Cyclobacteriaceae bacterium]
MKRILVPFDFSPQSIEALKFATTLATKEEADIFLIHAIEFPAIINSSVALEYERKYVEVHRARAIKSMNKIADRLAKRINVEKLIDFGGPLPAIEQAIKNAQADTVVMGTQGASGLKELTVGSNTQKVVRRSSVPVIAIRKSVKEINNIIMPVPPEGDVEKEIVESIKRLQQLFNAQLHIVFVNTPLEFGKDILVKPALEAFARRHHLENFTLNIFNDVTQAEGIMNFTKNLEKPMVAMGTHGRRGISHLANGSVTEDVLNHINCPVATFRIKNK